MFDKNFIKRNAVQRILYNITNYRSNSKKYKSGFDELNEYIKRYNDEKLKKKIKKYITDTEQDKKEIIIKIENIKDNGIFFTDDNVYQYGQWIHKNEIFDMMQSNPETIVVHKVEFYENNKQVNEYETIDEDDNTELIKDLPLKFEFTSELDKNEINDKIVWKVNINGSSGIWKVQDFIQYSNKYNIDRYVKLITTSYRKLPSDFTEQVSIIQRYAKSFDTGTCVYDGLCYYFSKYVGTKNKYGVAVHNKLMKYKEKYAKSYTVEEMEILGKDLNVSFTICDLIDNKNIDINKGNNARFNVSYVNTRYNHVDLLKCVSNVVDVTTDYYNEIKDSCKFYVERFGTLMTLDGNYKIKNTYTELVNDWKKKYNINGCAIEIDSDINKFIKCYDDKVHRFFDIDMTIDNALYSELDLKKAYFNYTKSKNYIGLPSGAYISCSGEGMTDDIFLKQFKNKLVGFYEVSLVFNNNINLNLYCNLEKYGLFSSKENKESKHVLFTSTIKLLLDRGVTFKYYNYVVSPSINAPFSKDFLKFIDGDNLVEDKGKKDLVKAYCKIVGCMMIESKDFKIEIKADSNDKEFYKTLTKKNKIYNVDGVYKIVKEKSCPRSLKHIALSIHAYSSTIILDQLLDMKPYDVFGVKVDSIVFKKGVEITYDNDLFKEPSKAKIQSLLLQSYEDREDETKREYFKKYFIESNNKINFDKSFCGEHITNRVIILTGAGGCGKTFSVMNSTNFLRSETIFTSSCWELITNVANEYDVTGVSMPKLIGEINGKTCEKFNTSNYKYIVDDELTLQNKKNVMTLINDNKDKFIILMGDVDETGFYFQCSIGDSVINPSKINCQCVKYTKNYRFEPSFNNKINKLRDFMKENKYKKNATKLLYDYFKIEFGECFRKRIKDIKYGDNDIGITALKPIDKDGKCKYSKHFYKLGTKEQFYIKDTHYKQGVYKGALLDEKPEGKNYINSLFRTIHSFQGRQLTQDNKIVILLDSLFDFNLLYTAISRARRLDQIIIFDMLK
jgi:hypothetical protein